MLIEENVGEYICDFGVTKTSSSRPVMHKSLRRTFIGYVLWKLQTFGNYHGL